MEGFRKDIEGLRGIAVLSVVGFHAGASFLRGGFVGVDIFFVLSGYLITGLLMREHRQRARIDLLGFYARRARRLLPAASLMLAATAIASAVIVAPSKQALFSRTALSTSIYLSNVWVIRNTGDYFASASEENPFLHTWSLAVEEQFYFLWPVLIFVFLRARRSERGLIGFLGLVTAASFAASAFLTPSHSVLAFFGMPTRAWEFGAGAVAALVPWNAYIKNERHTAMLGWLGAAMLLMSIVCFNRSLLFPGVLVALPGLGTVAVLVAASLGSKARPIAFLSIAPLQYSGQFSYSIYLWHWPALVLVADVVPQIGPAGKAVALLMALAVALVCYELVEKPTRHSAWISAHPRLVVASAGIIALASAGGSELWHRWSQVLAGSEGQRAFVLAKQDRAEVYASCFRRRSRYL